MCTVSWYFNEGSYSIYFNRDEQNTREAAQPPKVYRTNGISFLMPTDPVGGGSWLATNCAGVSVALLNFYQGIMPKQSSKVSSRGLIVKRLAACCSLDEADKVLRSLCHQGYAPFTLLLFAAGHDAVCARQWTGSQLKSIEPESPMISSSFDFDRVVQCREDVYTHLIANKAHADDVDYKQFHCSHGESRSAYSVCMHREDANTVSFSKIQVLPEETRYEYIDGSPCDSKRKSEHRLERHHDLLETLAG